MQQTKKICVNVEGLSRMISRAPATINKWRRAGKLPYILFGDSSKKRKVIIYPIEEVYKELGIKDDTYE